MVRLLSSLFGVVTGIMGPLPSKRVKWSESSYNECVLMSPKFVTGCIVNQNELEPVTTRIHAHPNILDRIVDSSRRTLWR